ncbi:MAG: hypothetical protein QXI86_03480 [Ignisphaera sp.]
MNIELLKSLANATNSDSIMIIGTPNVCFIARVDIDRDNIVIAYKRTTDECKMLVPIDAKEKLPISLQGKCSIVYYSFDLREREGYVIGRNFEEILIGFLKSFIEPNTEIGVPFRYIDSALAQILHKYWKIKDITKSLISIRAKKSYEDLENIAEIFRFILKILRELRELQNHNIIEEYFKHVAKIVNAIYIEPLAISKDFVSIYTYIKKGIYRLSFKVSIPLSEDVKRIIEITDDILEKLLKNVITGSKCSDVYRNIVSRLDMYSGKNVYIDVCGVGTEVCEYPSLSDFLYGDCTLDSGMALVINVVLRKLIYLPKLIIVKEGIVVI